MHPTLPIAAQVEELAWIAGHWVGEHDVDRIEEVWTEPYAGMMLGMFRWHRNGQPRFYELVALEPEGSGLAIRIKHFDPGLVGWEEREESVTLDLVALREREAVFLKRGEERWMVYRLEPESGDLVAWFETVAEPHAPGDEFRYSRG
jgi:Domain of unknown function (DUF6265)